MCIRCMEIPTSHIISNIWLSSPMIVLIDVSLSHHYFPSFPIIILFAILVSTIFLVLIHCMSARNRKGDNQFDLCLASGLWTSHNKILKETKCETLVD